jgi:diacylglycerol kinase family enzyme
MSQKSCDLFFNLGSGTEANSRFSKLKSALVDAGFEIVHSWKVGNDISFSDALKKLEASPTQLVVVAGGDGTLSGVTSTLVKTKKTMGAIPSGTFNYFARNRKIPEIMSEAVANLVRGREQAIPVGKVNHQYFLNTASFGLYPKALKKRKQHYKTWGRGRAVALVSLLSTLLSKHTLYKAVLRTEKGEESTVTPFVFVSTNEFQLEAMGLRGQHCLDHQKLAIYITACLSFTDSLWLACKAALRKLEQAGEYTVTCASSLEVELKREKINVAIDGELHSLESPLEFLLVPNALRVILPTEEKQNP